MIETSKGGAKKKGLRVLVGMRVRARASIEYGSGLKITKGSTGRVLRRSDDDADVLVQWDAFTGHAVGSGRNASPHTTYPSELDVIDESGNVIDEAR